MPAEEKGSTSAKILYRPFGLISSLFGAVVASVVFKQVWKHATPGDESDSPKALESEYSMGDQATHQLTACAAGPSGPSGRGPCAAPASPVSGWARRSA